MGRWSNWLMYLPINSGRIDGGDLGTVTVKGDGDEEYDGPLKGFKPKKPKEK
jgi:hypothetical protein